MRNYFDRASLNLILHLSDSYGWLNHRLHRLSNSDVYVTYLNDVKHRAAFTLSKMPNRRAGETKFGCDFKLLKVDALSSSDTAIRFVDVIGSRASLLTQRLHIWLCHLLISTLALPEAAKFISKKKELTSAFV